jgi:hypothetical protein
MVVSLPEFPTQFAQRAGTTASAAPATSILITGNKRNRNPGTALARNQMTGFARVTNPTETGPERGLPSVKRESYRQTNALENVENAALRKTAS